MCYYKSEVQKYEDLMAHYAASFDSITGEMELIREKFTTLLAKDDELKSIGLANMEALGSQLTKYNAKNALPSTLTKPELTQLRWYQRFLSAYQNPEQHERFYENGFDYFPTPIITAGEPDKFKMFHWGFYKNRISINPQINTLNCISEEMWDKATFKEAVEKGQRCLIPVTAFYEWRWLDEAGKVKIPYLVTWRDQQVRSMGGLYMRGKDPVTGEFYYSYTILTCPANTVMQYVHNHKKRQPVFINREDEKAWLDRSLSKSDVMQLCQTNNDPAMRAITISKLLTTNDIDRNVPQVMKPFNYNPALEQMNAWIAAGQDKLAVEMFKKSISESGKGEQVKIAAGQEVIAELSMAS
jgi:putative SOS response-associated peptidase YedK